jgi:hypothetical protein
MRETPSKKEPRFRGFGEFSALPDLEDDIIEWWIRLWSMVGEKVLMSTPSMLKLTANLKSEK